MAERGVGGGSAKPAAAPGPTDPLEMFRDRFARYRALAEQHGDAAAWEALLEGYPERQKAHMGPLISGARLADGFRKAVPMFQRIGLDMEVFDVSNAGVDAALEVQRRCPFSALGKEHGFERPCRVICEMDVEATRRAFPELRGAVLCARADGHAVCVFKYERPDPQRGEGA